MALLPLKPLALAAAALLPLVACGKNPVASEPAPERSLANSFAPPASSTGAEACMDCHEELVEAYSHSAMARALGPLTKEELGPLTELPPEASSSGFHYGVYPTPGGEAFALGETRPTSPAFGLGKELLFGIGAGVRDRSLAVRHGSGMYFAPVEVLSVEGGRSLSLSPAEMASPGQRFSFPISPECLGCHTDAPPPLTYPLNLAPEDFEPRGISCGGCHGAAPELASHVTFQEADLAGEQPSGPDPLLRLAELPRTRRMSICAACHLQGDARIELENHTLGAFQAGRELTETRAVFVGREATDEVGFVSQTERLVLSACYQAAELDCTTCHNPHAALSGSKRETERVRMKCQSCHAPADPGAAHCTRTPAKSDGDCVSCHMPQTGVFDVAGIQIHDHFIRTRPAARPPAAPEEVRFAESPSGDWRRFTWPGEPPPSTLDDLGLWMMAYAGGGHLEEAMELVDADPGNRTRDLAMYHHVRATLLDGMQRTEEAKQAYELALALDPDLAISATNLGLLQAQLGFPDKGLVLLSDLLKRFPKAAGPHRNRALVRRQLGDDAGFIADLERAFQLDPSAELAASLAAALDAAGTTRDPKKAERYRQLAKELDPR